MKKPTIAIATITNSDRQYMMLNYFNSLVDLKPDEVCILDTTIDEKKSEEFQNWLKEQAKKCNLPLKLKYLKWPGNFSVAKNTNLDRCTTDWIFDLDSDEMLTKEISKDLRSKLASLPPESLVLRTGILNLLDDKHCIAAKLSQGKRSTSGHHGRILKRGSGKYVGSLHEQYIYPGRNKIPWDSPKHPKKDWFGYYYLHLWLYKDNPLIRQKWSIQDYRYQLKKLNDKISKEDWAMLTQKIIAHRRWNVIDVPKGVTWFPISWKIDKNLWKKR